MKYILYVLSFFCLLIGGGAWFFYNHSVGLLGVLAALYILWRQEKKPRPLALRLGDGKGKSRVSSQDQADFTKALRDFNAMEGERRSLTDPDLVKTVANMQHVALNFLYYLQQYPDRIPIASHFINYYQDRAVYMIRKYKKLTATGLKTEKVTTSQKRLKQLLSQLDEAYEEQFTQVLDTELTDVDGETAVMAHHLEADGIYEDRRQRTAGRSSSSSLKGSFSRWKKQAADRF
ncbi:5-bromo-4-chloroindolyl phosphate hydrolysis family protein, partial [uncultured Megasphaera sp.]|uniref:5-bromo-4-chloroindolyl phosphate hydrolysis family protein n=1 Tax=uncultured Megasphaera sp. TaxID=165188 RepID=UPI00260155D1